MGNCELIYLWVEKYKNIVLKGFNLSPRFECKYEVNNLFIKRKEYIDIFPTNINVTALIGLNGSGKTSLLEIIQLLCFEAKNVTHNDEHIWGIFYDCLSDKFYCASLIYKNIGFDFIQIKDEYDNNITEYYRSNEVIELEEDRYYFYGLPKNIFYNIWYNPSAELVSSNFLNYIQDISREFYGNIYDLDFKPSQINIFAFPAKKQGIINIKQNENNVILNMFKVKNLIDEKILESLENQKLIFIPKVVGFKININELEYNIKQHFIREIVLNSLTLNIKDLYRYYLAMIFSSVIISYENQNFNEYFLKDESEIKKYLINKYNEIDISNPDYNYRLKKMYENIYVDIDEFIELTKNISLYDSLKDDSQLNFNVNEISKLIDNMKKYNIKTFPNSTSEISKILILLKDLPSFVDVNTKDKYEANFSDFSYGEKNIIQLLYSSLYYLILFKDKILNIVLDEIELGLNPKWQKELMYILLKLLTIKEFSNTKFNIFLSSHSPFILSDIPKSNIVFLKKGVQNIQNIDTFGANVHTLLSHNFFMDKCLMGEFAKEKINETIENLHGDLSSLSKTQIKSIIEIVGEPFLKLKLKQMYDEKFGIDDELEELKKQREQLNLKINLLKKQRQDNVKS